MEEFNAKQFWEQRLSDDYSLKGVGYQGLGQGFNQWMYRIRARVFRKSVAPLLQKTEQPSVLDIGSGTGFYISQFRAAGVKKLTGLDITEAAISQLTQNFPEYQFLLKDIGTREYPPAEPAYDLISCFDVLFHIVDDGAFKTALSNCFYSLHPGGYFVFSDNMPQKELRRKHHVSRSKKDILYKVAAVGFEVVSVSPMFVLLNEPVSTRNWLLKLHWYFHGLLLRFLPVLGHLTGALLYWPEAWLIGHIKNGPSTKLIVCRKPDKQPD